MRGTKVSPGHEGPPVPCCCFGHVEVPPPRAAFHAPSAKQPKVGPASRKLVTNWWGSVEFMLCSRLKAVCLEVFHPLCVSN